MISPPLDGDNRNWYGAQMHNIWFLQTLGKALTDAREGRLTVDWRDHLTTPCENPEPAVVLAVEEVRQMPIAAWEPGHAPDWRQALDAWYATARVVLASRYSNRTQSTLKLVEMTARNLTHVLHPTQPLEEYLRTTVDQIDENSDSTLQKQYEGYVRDRDIMRADYLSGLCAAVKTTTGLAGYAHASKRGGKSKSTTPTGCECPPRRSAPSRNGCPRTGPTPNHSAAYQPRPYERESHQLIVGSVLAGALSVQRLAIASVDPDSRPFPRGEALGHLHRPTYRRLIEGKYLHPHRIITRISRMRESFPVKKQIQRPHLAVVASQRKVGAALRHTRIDGDRVPKLPLQRRGDRDARPGPALSPRDRIPTHRDLPM